MRRIRLDRNSSSKEKQQKINLTAAELRAMLDKSFEEGKEKGKTNSAEALQYIISARQGERLLKERAIQELVLVVAREVRAARAHAEEVEKYEGRIRELELTGPLGLLHNRVKSNERTKATDQKAGPSLRRRRRVLRDR